MKEHFFSSKNIALMSLFGSLSSLVTLTTAFIPAPLPGLYAVIAIPVGTVLVLTAREIVGKTGAATFTQFLSGVISTLLPGGPPVRWIIIPTWVMGGIAIDFFLHMTRRDTYPSRLVSGIAGFIYNIPGDFLLYLVFNMVLQWAWSLPYFLYGFVAIHAILGGIAGLFTPTILDRIKPVIG
jgi:ABC-type thiamin/hydroxymethylpyrimidine transport system permease subunit